MAQSFPYFSSSSSTPPSSSRIPFNASSTPTLPQLPSKRESNLSTSSISPQTHAQSQNQANRQSSLHQHLFQQAQNGGILDRPLNKSKGAEVSMGAWAFMFAEIVSYSQSRVDSVTDLEKRLSSLGYEAGSRILSLLLLRNTQASGTKEPKREHRLIPALQFVHTQVYKYIFGKPADGLERSVEGEDEYMLTLNQPPLTQHISIPKDMSQLSVEAYTAGLVEGVMDGLGLPARVTAHTVGTDQFPQRTVILIKLDQKVMDREAVLGK